MEFGIRVSKATVTLTSVPKEYGKKGFVKRLPKVLSQRPLDFVTDFLGFEPETGVLTIEKNSKGGKHVVGSVSFGNRSGKRNTGPDALIQKTKVLINRNNGLGIRLCFIPDELVGKRVDVY
jgi:hypothetical protein